MIKAIPAPIAPVIIGAVSFVSAGIKPGKLNILTKPNVKFFT